MTVDELQLYKVLLDETREDILNHLSDSTTGWTASELARHFGLKLPTIVSHLKKLEQVGAVRKYQRKGRHVNRPVVYYKGNVKVGGFKEQIKQAETAMDLFKKDMSTAIFHFLQKRDEVVPALSDPTNLLEWLELLLKRATSSVAELVLQQPDQLAQSPKLQSLAAKVAALGLLNDCWSMMIDPLWNLAAKRDRRLAEIARKYGIRKLKEGSDALFVMEVIEDLLSKNDSKRLQAQVALTQIVDLLPSGTSWKKELKEILPYMVRAHELLDERSAVSLYNFQLADPNLDSMVARWRKSGRLLKEALQRQPTMAA